MESLLLNRAIAVVVASFITNVLFSAFRTGITLALTSTIKRASFPRFACPSKRSIITIFWLLFLMLCFANNGAEATTRNTVGTKRAFSSAVSWRGGASSRQRTNTDDDPFLLVAEAIQDRFLSDNYDEPSPKISEIKDALIILSSSQQTFKGLDGVAHEAYQRTHAGDEVDISVAGRARRSAARAAATADGLGACELCELLEAPLLESSTQNGTLAGGRHVLLNITAAESSILLDGTKVSVVVLYEPVYRGGAGLLHGGIADETRIPPRSKQVAKGRILVIVGDELKRDLTKSLKVLDEPPLHIRLNTGLVTSEVASVQPALYKAAGLLLKEIEPTLRCYENKTSAIHFVGRSLGGGVANLAAIMLDGDLSLPEDKNRKSRKKKKEKNKEPILEGDVFAPSDESGEIIGTGLLSNATDTASISSAPLSGLGKGRTSAVSLGAPPSVSANIESDFIISIIYGDDVICRASRASLDRLIKRSKKALRSRGWIGGRQLNFMSDAFSLTVSSLKTHAHGSEGEELRLSIPGRAYLLRPRRLGGFCSIHEVGNRLKGGREVLRAHVLWQLDDILLSRSLWKHHQLDSYIHGLDRAHLRGFNDEEDDT